jgi:ubiquinone/menaquinone biosynthesis C-methylase UbiE
MKLVRESLDEKLIPYSERSKEEKEIITKYDQKVDSENWKELYKEEDDHWMKNLKPSHLAFEMIKDLKGKKGANILEIGIGNGRDSIFFAKKGHNVIGIDIAKQAIEVAQENLKNLKNLNIKFEVGKAEKLKYADEHFDAVYSIAALHSSIIHDTFSEIYRVLKPGGIAKLYLYTKTRSGNKWVYYWSPAQIKQEAKRIGFEIKKFRTGHNIDTIEIPGLKDEVEQESYLVITTFKKN